MRELQFIVPKEYEGVKGNIFLRRFCGVSTRLMLALKRVENGITADGKLLRVIDLVHAGQTVTLHLPESKECPQEAQGGAVPVVFEDEDLLVLDKPPYMPVHPSAGHVNDTLANAVALYLAQKGERATFRPINRLDRDTTGLVVTAKNAYAAAHLSGKVKKVYFAIAQGELHGKGVINAPLRKKEGYGIRREIGEGGETAVTHWESLGCGKGHTLVRVVIETGRTHQIRAHFSCTGHPLAGDDMYEGNRSLIERQALHCATVCFPHPVNGQELCLCSPLPEDFRQVLSACGMREPESSAWNLTEQEKEYGKPGRLGGNL